MTTSSTVSALDTRVRALRREHQGRAFVDEIAHLVTVLGTIPDSPPVDFTVDDRNRLREIADLAVEAIEIRIDSDEDSDSKKQHLASTIYEIRRRMEVIETWFTHAFPDL
jgi:hypothetical protein